MNGQPPVTFSVSDSVAGNERQLVCSVSFKPSFFDPNPQARCWKDKQEDLLDYEPDDEEQEEYEEKEEGEEQADSPVVEVKSSDRPQFFVDCTCSSVAQAQALGSQ